MAEALSVGQLGDILRRFWVLLLAMTVLGGVAAFGATQFMTPTYTATATQLIKGIPGTGVAANYEAAQYAVSRAKSYPSFIDSQIVLDGVRTDLGNRFTLTDLRRNLSATNPPDTPLLLITAVANTPTDARDMANSAARQMARFITQIETVSGKSPIAVETAVQAVAPPEPTSPRRLLLSAVGALAGFVLGIAIALLSAYGGLSRRRRKAAARKTGSGVEAPHWESASEVTASETAEADTADGGAVTEPPAEHQPKIASDGAGTDAPGESEAEARPDSEVESDRTGRTETVRVDS